MILSGAACAPSVANENIETPVLKTVEVEPAPEVLPENAVGDFQALLDEYISLNQRLENIAYKILTANAASCPETSRGVGMKIHTVHDYPDEIQMHARVFLGLDEQPAVRIVADGSPAFIAGLKSGDRVLKLGDFSLVSGRNAGQFFDALSVREFRKPTTEMEILRGERKQLFKLLPEISCGYPGQVFYSEQVNAHTDGEEIWITSELMRQVENDISLALIFAHELAHATQGHVYTEPTKALELEADRLSLIYIKAAGYDPEEAVRLWRDNPLHHNRDQSQSHPTMSERLKVLSATLQEISSDL